MCSFLARYVLVLLLVYPALQQAYPTTVYQVNPGVVNAGVPATTPPAQNSVATPSTPHAGGIYPPTTNQKKTGRDKDYLPEDLKRAMTEFQNISPNSAQPGFARYTGQPGSEYRVSLNTFTFTRYKNVRKFPTTNSYSTIPPVGKTWLGDYKGPAVAKVSVN